MVDCVVEYGFQSGQLMVSCLSRDTRAAPCIPFLAMMWLNFVYGSPAKEGSEVFDATLSPNYARWFVNVLFCLEPAHGDALEGKLRIFGVFQP